MAQPQITQEIQKLITPADSADLWRAVAKIFKVGLEIAGVIAVIAVIVTGLMFVTSTGDPAKVARARNALLAAILGTLIISLAYGLALLIQKRVTGQ